MKRFLFQGDSITDAGRFRDDLHALGTGYPVLTGSKLSYMFPAEYEFINKGISGNRIVDVYQRIKEDIINLKPDYMSFLIGINDLWHEYARENGVAAKKFEKIYNMLIEEILEALPNIKIIILEPFVLKGSATEENWERFSTDIVERASIAKGVAENFGLPFISLKKEFEILAGNGDTSIWLKDGVHPNIAGHQYISERLIEEFLKIR